MKILFCINTLGYGGAEKSLSTVANGLSRRGHDISICTLNPYEVAQPVESAIRLIHAPEFSRRGVKRLQQLHYIYQLCKKEKPELVVSFLTMPNVLCAIAGKLAGIPVIVSERGDPYAVEAMISQVFYRIYRLAKGAVFQTDGAKAYFCKALQAKGTVIPNPVSLKDENVYTDYNACTKSVVYAARFEVRQKRQDLMLRAFAHVHEKHPEYKLDFYGDGPDQAAMEQLTKDLGLETAVDFKGVSSALLQDMAKSEIFVLSSDYEGIPNSLMEAMAIGLPCVSTDCSPGGARMLIKNGENGILVPRNDETALAEGLCKMIENREFAIQCGKTATQIRDRFDKRVIMDRWENYCIEIARKGKGRIKKN